MIDVADLRIFVCTTPTNMTYSFDSLMGRVQEVFDQDPTSGHLFLFFNRRRDRLKILFWDHDGFAIFYKRLEAGAFQVLTTTDDPEGIEQNRSDPIEPLPRFRRHRHRGEFHAEQFFEHPEARERFQREARSLASLQHANVVSVS